VSEAAACMRHAEGINGKEHIHVSQSCSGQLEHALAAEKGKENTTS